MRSFPVASVILSTCLSCITWGTSLESLPELQLSSLFVGIEPEERIAALWVEEHPLSEDDDRGLDRICSASSLGNGYWITALHCVGEYSTFTGFIEQKNGRVSRVEQVFFRSDSHDIALLKVSKGGIVHGFELPNRNLKSGEDATLIGIPYGANNATRIPVRIRAMFESVAFVGAEFRHLLKSESTSDLRSCPGVSGGAVFIEDTIYAVHTGAEGGPLCNADQKRTMWHTDLYSSREWIREIMESNSPRADDELPVSFQHRLGSSQNDSRGMMPGELPGNILQ